MRPLLWLERTERLLNTLRSINLELEDAKDRFILVLEELNRRGKRFSRKAILRHGGIDILKLALRAYVEDEIIVTLSMQLLTSFLLEDEVDVRLAAHGFNETLQKVIEHYSNVGDKFIQSDAQKHLDSICQVESRVATEEIRQMVVAYQHDVPLKQQSIEFVLKYTYSLETRLPIKIPSDALHEEWGINRALHLMMDYSYEDVVAMGLQLIITHLSKQRTSEICRASFIQTLLCVLSKYPSSRRIHMRGCSLFLELCDTQNGSTELVKHGALSLLMEWNATLKNDIGMKQLILLCISILVKGETIKELSTETYDKLKCFLNGLLSVESSPHDIVIPLNLRLSEVQKCNRPN